MDWSLQKNFTMSHPPYSLRPKRCPEGKPRELLPSHVAVTQLVECFSLKEDVVGSSPTGHTESRSRRVHAHSLHLDEAQLDERAAPTCTVLGSSPGVEASIRNSRTAAAACVSNSVEEYPAYNRKVLGSYPSSRTMKTTTTTTTTAGRTNRSLRDSLRVPASPNGGFLSCKEACGGSNPLVGSISRITRARLEAGSDVMRLRNSEAECPLDKRGVIGSNPIAGTTDHFTGRRLRCVRCGSSVAERRLETSEAIGSKPIRSTLRPLWRPILHEQQ